MVTKIKLLKVFLGIAAFIFLVSFSAKRHACKAVSELKIQINHNSTNRFVNNELVEKIMNGKEINIKSTPLGNIDVYKIEAELNENPFIEKSEVYSDIDGSVLVSIVQREAIARINTGKQEYYLSANLTKIPLSELYSPVVLMVGGPIDENDYEGLKHLTDVISADKLLKKHIIAAKKLGPNSFNLLVNKGGYVIEFGELEDIEKKFEKLKLFYDQYLGKVGMNYYSKINLKFNNQIVATKNKNDEKQ